MCSSVATENVTILAVQYIYGQRYMALYYARVVLPYSCYTCIHARDVAFELHIDMSILVMLQFW